jgi:diguanylate cyclase (GGDEF)-like protein
MSNEFPTETIREARQKSLRVLIAETGGGEVSRTLEQFCREGGESLELTSVSNATTLLPTIQMRTPQIIFLDLALFPNEPVTAVRSVHRAAPNIPLVTVADASAKKAAEQSLQEGAIDYVLREHADGATLSRVLRAALQRNTVLGLTDLLRDPQTGLHNTEGFTALAEKAVQTAERTGGQLILFTAALENMTALREEYGPSAGEQAIRDVAALLRGSFRKSDVVARLGETEFAVLAIDAAEPSAAVMVQRVKTHLVGLNETRKTWGKLELRLNAKFWSALGGQEMSEFLGNYAFSGSRTEGRPQATVERERLR